MSTPTRNALQISCFFSLASRRGRLTSLGLLLASALVMAGCGSPVQRKLEGRWLGESVENFDAKEMAAATGWARGLSLEFSGTHLTVAVPAEEPRTGKYKVASVHENDVELAVTRLDGAVDTASFKLDDDRSLRFMIGDNRAVVLRREQ
ncbi:MAG TPA: hypothetical protein VHW01_10130 [Polyangiaceae bacterium]|nr:hypothetical protein [Polyangiaceae bacterium]